MPVRQVKTNQGTIGFQWGTQGKVYPTYQQALKQGQAIKAQENKKK